MLIEAHRDLSDEQSALLNAKLILLLANHIGDLDPAARSAQSGTRRRMIPDGENSMLIKKIHHVAYRCKDAKETVEWYGKYLNMNFVLAIAENEVPSTREPIPTCTSSLMPETATSWPSSNCRPSPDGARSEYAGMDAASRAGSRFDGGTAGRQGPAGSRRYQGGRPDRPHHVPVDLFL
jgi:catechol 2,3-dioxygenase-like lactoylglutathione lyase family enzyme